MVCSSSRDLVNSVALRYSILRGSFARALSVFVHNVVAEVPPRPATASLAYGVPGRTLPSIHTASETQDPAGGRVSRRHEEQPCEIPEAHAAVPSRWTRLSLSCEFRFEKLTRLRT